MKRGLLLTGGGDKVMRLWSLGNYKCLEEYSTPDSTSVIDFNFDEYKIVGLLGTRICIWRRDGARSVFPPCEGTFSKGLCMQYLDPEAMVGCEDGTVRVFDMYSKKCSRIIRMHTGSVTCLCVSDDQLVLSGSSLGNVSISSLSSDQQVSKLRTRDSTVTFCRTIRILWENRVSPNVLYSLQHLRNDSSTLVVGGIDGEVVSRIVLAGSISSSRDKNGIVARTRGARLAEDVHTLR
ncbi:F-box/WD-40 repeat-containing protein At3g52030-like [Cannabis sativa]|uniref:F-box/WD-40 repeat-containing protein At3g52030-like n=1 Tax=Cannabis sativa TaxID=3483 RepID=UPI0029C9BD07|nr:F-box/WD-40 repeat-containing protein At3g52030-like [Cannabis sativa]